jgi:hypothetical protein
MLQVRAGVVLLFVFFCLLQVRAGIILKSSDQRTRVFSFALMVGSLSHTLGVR